MLIISFVTMPFGFTEPLFVPEYWNPPSLFNLAQTTGFDIESLIFCFAIGGIGSVLYRLIIPLKLTPMDIKERLGPKHRFHFYTFSVPVIVFLTLSLFSDLNHIYCGIIAMFAGAIAAIYCRNDLKWKIWIGGLLFFLLYFVFFSTLIWIYPGYVELVWNLDSISGVLFLGIPLEEYLFAFTFGMFWSSLYEHIFWYKLLSIKAI